MPAGYKARWGIFHFGNIPRVVSVDTEQKCEGLARYLSTGSLAFCHSRKAPML
ncbi:hypothetical protein EV662_10354 [Rhodovulum marinum]|uniref:Uncharacterized protein n=1 Tax=Rhodovulum marinum TaxID=320662 RepID=A0A4R2Q195_9RHOB|nr:hypothetical protein EV662_10354 [Rhodovulum marinum]